MARALLFAAPIPGDVSCENTDTAHDWFDGNRFFKGSLSASLA
jgi:hypothetical protein